MLFVFDLVQTTPIIACEYNTTLEEEDLVGCCSPRCSLANSTHSFDRVAQSAGTDRRVEALQQLDQLEERRRDARVGTSAGLSNQLRARREGTDLAHACLVGAQRDLLRHGRGREVQVVAERAVDRLQQCRELLDAHLGAVHGGERHHLERNVERRRVVLLQEAAHGLAQMRVLADDWRRHQTVDERHLGRDRRPCANDAIGLTAERADHLEVLLDRRRVLLLQPSQNVVQRNLHRAAAVSTPQ